MERAVRRGLVPRRAAIAALTGVAMLGVGVGSAGAIHVAAPTVAAGSTPSIAAGTSNQAAGNLTFTFAPAAALIVGETFVLSLDDSDGDANCVAVNSTTDFVAFTTLPTVTVTGTATVTPSFTPSGGCGAGKTDQVTLLVTAAGTASTIVVSNVRYDVGTTGVSGGPVKVIATGTAPLPAVPSNATVTLATPASLTVTPRVAVRSGTGVSPVSNFVITEGALDTFTAANANICVSLSSGSGFELAPAPTVAVSGGTGDTATAILQPNGRLRIAVTDAAADTGPSTLTVSGLRLSATTTDALNAGLVTAIVTADAGATCAAVVPVLAGPTGVATVVDVERLSGTDRYATAQALFEDGFPCTAGGNGLANVIIARGDAFPDALAASFLAGSRNTGILLVDRESTTLPAATVAALRNRGVDNAIIVGGDTAIPPALATAIDNLPNYKCDGTPEAPAVTMSVNRIGGGTRYETAKNVAAGTATPALSPPPPLVVGTADYDGTAADPDGAACAPKKTAILATGENFPDALVAGPVAFNGHNVPNPPNAAPSCGDGLGFPVVLTTGSALHPDAAATLTNLGIEQVLVMGGTTVIDPAVVTSVQGINSITVKRFAGTNRLDTSKQFAEFAIDFLGYSRTAVGVATGFTFPDALAGGPNAGAFGLPIVLTTNATTVGAETLAFFGERQGTSGVFSAPTPLVPITAIDVYGGITAIADSTVDAILAAILTA